MKPDAMSTTVTRKDINLFANAIVQLPHFEAQFLTHFATRFGYNTGVYGWNYDCFLIHLDGSTIAVTYGDRPIGKAANYKLCKRYGQKAEKICYNNKLSRNQKSYYVNLLLRNLLKKLGY